MILLQRSMAKGRLSATGDSSCYGCHSMPTCSFIRTSKSSTCCTNSTLIILKLISELWKWCNCKVTFFTHNIYISFLQQNNTIQYFMVGFVWYIAWWHKCSGMAVLVKVASLVTQCVSSSLGDPILAMVSWWPSYKCLQKFYRGPSITVTHKCIALVQFCTLVLPQSIYDNIKCNMFHCKIKHNFNTFSISITISTGLKLRSRGQNRNENFADPPLLWSLILTLTDVGTLWHASCKHTLMAD